MDANAQSSRMRRLIRRAKMEPSKGFYFIVIMFGGLLSFVLIITGLTFVLKYNDDGDSHSDEDDTEQQVIGILL